MTTPEDVTAAAIAALTDAQYAAWNLHRKGHGTRSISIHLNISRAAVNDRLHAAGLRLREAGIYQDGSGNWHLTRKDAA